MTDNFSLGDNKADNKITENVGKSPLEQSNSTGNHEEVAQEAGAMVSPVDGGISQPNAEPEVASAPQGVEPQVQPVNSSPGVDLPPGVESAPAPDATTPQPSVPVSNNLDDSSPTPAVLQEKALDDEGKMVQPPASSESPATLNALKGEPGVGPLPQANLQEPKPETPSVEQPEAEQDFGEPSKAPDTDEFLKSILDDKTGMPDGSTPQPELPAEPVQPTPPAQPQPPVPSPAEFQSSNNDFSSELGIVNHPDTPVSQEIPEPTPLSDKSPIDGQNLNIDQGGSKPVGGVGIDSISGQEPPTAEGDDMLNANRPKRKSSSLKIILAVFLAALVVAIGYYVYTMLFSAQDSVRQSSVDEIPGEIDYSAGLESATYATDDEQRKADLAQIKSALLDYFAGQGEFPVAKSLTLLTASNILETELVPTHLTVFPVDPSVAKSYGYISDGSTFTLSAILDDSSDADVVVKDGQAIYSIVYDPTKATVSASATSTPKSSSSASPEVMPTGEDELSGGTY